VLPRGTNIFDDWKWPGTKGRPDDRDDWSVDDLNMLLRSSWFAPEKRGTDYWWATVIGMFSGLRVEETARLRPAHDFKEFSGVLCMVVQDQGDWSPKTEAGERVVPVHPRLLELGLRDLLARRHAEGSYRLLPHLKKGPRGNLGAYLSKDFSSHKISIGVGEKTVLHSFRHNIRTQLGNVHGLQETWIDAVLGHRRGSRSDGQQSVGAMVYLKRIGVTNLDWTVRQIDYGPDVEMWRLDPR
jgi:integrase